MPEHELADHNLALGAKEVQETILMLNLSVAQIELSISDGDNSVNTLIDSFSFMSQHITQIQTASQQIADLATKNGDSGMNEHQSLLVNEACELSQKMQQAVIAFQFYDKLSQRMVLVSKTLALLNEVLKDKEKMNNKGEWENLQKMIRSKYTLDADQEMFDAVLKGAPIEEALKIAVKKTTENDIEFF